MGFCIFNIINQTSRSLLFNVSTLKNGLIFQKNIESLQLNKIEYENILTKNIDIWTSAKWRK